MGFQRGGSSKKALDLGGMSFETLRDGSILKTKKRFGLTSTGNFRSYNGAKIPVKVGAYILVMGLGSAENSKSKSFYFWKATVFEWLYHSNPELLQQKKEQAYNVIKNRQENYFQGVYDQELIIGRPHKIKSISKTKFNNLFEIIETPK